MRNIFLTVIIIQVLFTNSIHAKKPLDDKLQEKLQNKLQSSEDRYENLALFQKVLSFIEKNYVEEVKNKALVYGAIKGMLDTLDPHSNFLPPEIFKEMRSDTTGKFSGVGIEIGQRDSYLTVVSPIEDTPAFRAGIKSGDRIIKINGESTKGLSIMDAVAKMRGKKGGEVTITIWRKGLDKPKDIKMTREDVKIQSVKSESLEPGYFYSRITNFNEHTSPDLKKAMEKYGETIKGMILDLRNNPGGLLDQAVDVTSLFIDDGVVVSTMGKNKDSKEIKHAKKGNARKDFQLAILVNGSSASASEIVAGALQDHHRAVVMGQPTFGKGSVQTVVEILPDVGLKLTIARYYTPSGRSIQLKGIQPDVLLDDLDQKVLHAATKKKDFLREKDLKNAMAVDMVPDILTDPLTDDLTDLPGDKEKEKDGNTLKPFVAKEDYQVKEALNYIKSYQKFRDAETKK